MGCFNICHLSIGPAPEIYTMSCMTLEERVRRTVQDDSSVDCYCSARFLREPPTQQGAHPANRYHDRMGVGCLPFPVTCQNGICVASLGLDRSWDSHNLQHTPGRCLSPRPDHRWKWGQKATGSAKKKVGIPGLCTKRAGMGHPRRVSHPRELELTSGAEPGFKSSAAIAALNRRATQKSRLAPRLAVCLKAYSDTNRAFSSYRRCIPSGPSFRQLLCAEDARGQYPPGLLRRSGCRGSFPSEPQAPKLH